ncbi:MAG: ACP S-malonyltransferase [Spirochaetes bacterium]|nr:ACP S-malonyltransferase [Spirochaetota bacterium]
MSLTINALFPGQGSQKSGMGKDIYESSPAAKEIFDTANRELGMDIKALCFEGSEEDLKKTENTQPCILTTSIAFWAALREKGVTIAVAAGHSLGEFSALTAAGYIPFKDCVRVVRERGLIMAGADKEGRGGMAAVLSLDAKVIEEICAGDNGGIVVVANYNSLEQSVISGDKDAVAKASAAATAKGAKRVVPLPVSGAFHSPLMNDAAKEFAGVLAKFTFTESAVPVISNVTAAAHVFPELKTKLVEQMHSSVRWVASMQKLTGMNDSVCCEVGPNKVLAGLMKKIVPTREVKNAGTAADVAAIG